MRQFLKEYQIYKDTFDLELMLTATQTTYAKAKQNAQQSEEWF